MKVLVIQADNAATLEEAPSEEMAQLRWMQDKVAGHITAVRGDDWAAVCNEDGMPLGLPTNWAATALAKSLGWLPLPGDRLVGTVVFTGRRGNKQLDVQPVVLKQAEVFGVYPAEAEGSGG